MPTYSNPRTEAEFDDWPFGRQRCRCRFVVETDKRGRQRVARTTENKTRTGWNKPKRTTYAERFVIVDGDDGKTYLLSYHTDYGEAVGVCMSDVQHTAGGFRPEDSEFAEFKALIFGVPANAAS